MRPRTDEAEANSGVKEQDARGGSGRGTSRETRRDFGVPLYVVSNLYLSAAGLGPIQSQWLL